METYTNSAGELLYHAVYLDPSGFVIVPAEDQVEPIIAFVQSGRFDPSLTNPLGALISRDVPLRVAQARAQGSTAATLSTRAKWQTLQQSAAGGPRPLGIDDSAISDMRIAPFIQTAWNQGNLFDFYSNIVDYTTFYYEVYTNPVHVTGVYTNVYTNVVTTPVPGTNYVTNVFVLKPCFNYFTPPHEAGNVTNFVSGCVATATAQLMYYFQYPTAGVGTPCFTITVDGNSMSRNLRGGDGKGGPYDWGDMPLDPNVWGSC